MSSSRARAPSLSHFVSRRIQIFSRISSQTAAARVHATADSVCAAACRCCSRGHARRVAPPICSRALPGIVGDACCYAEHRAPPPPPGPQHTPRNINSLATQCCPCPSNADDTSALPEHVKRHGSAVKSSCYQPHPYLAIMNVRFLRIDKILQDQAVRPPLLPSPTHMM